MNGLTFKSSSTDSKLFNYLAQYDKQYHGKKVLDDFQFKWSNVRIFAETQKLEPPCTA